MNFPPLLLGVTLLFWGWETKLLPVAAVGAVLVELPHLIRWRWEFTATDMNRLWDLCEILFIGAAVVAYASTDVATGPVKFMPWLPIIFFPFVAATGYAAQDQVRLSTYFWLLRKRSPTNLIGRFVPYWYFVVCFIAVSIVNARDVRFYAAVVVLGAWLLWSNRSRAVPAWAWALAIVGVAGGGFFGHIGLTKLQEMAENAVGQWVGSFQQPETDISQTSTAIGWVGNLKLSNRVVLRLATDDRQLPPELLRRASFDTYDPTGRRASWRTTGSEFGDLPPGDDVGTWPLTASANTASVARIEMLFPQGAGILPIPNGSARLENLLAGSAETNRYGSVRSRDASPLVRYTVKYGGTETTDAAPTARDLDIPELERPALAQIAGELGLRSRSPAAALAEVAAFFHNHFTYRRYLRGAGYDPLGKNTPLRRFLLNDRAGHCEYFATATTLLLREAGIPTRYAVGYSVPDDGRGGVQLVRARHAHAWVLAYIDGAWRDFDTTPASWEEVENDARAPWQPVTDMFSRLRYAVAGWRYYSDRGFLLKVVLWIAPVVLGWFGWRIFSRKRRQHPAGPANQTTHRQLHGLDSEFYRIAAHLTKAGQPRRAEESIGDWLRRLELTGTLRDVVTLHYAYRFDPRGITGTQRRELRMRVEAWLASRGDSAQSNGERNRS